MKSSNKRYAEKVFLVALVLYVLVLPVSGTAALRSLAFALLIGVTGWQVMTRSLRLDFPLLWPWAAYLSVALVSLLYAVDLGYSLSEIRVEIIYAYTLFVIAASWFRREDQLVRLVWIVVCGNLLFVAGSAWTALRSWKTQVGELNIGTWDAGIGATATLVATVLPWIVVLVVRTIEERRYRVTVFLVGLFLANLGALVLTLNRQGWVALTVSFTVAAALAGRSFWTRRRVLVASATAALFLAVFASQFQLRSAGGVGLSATAADASMEAVKHDPRWPIWRFTLERIEDRPWSGGGFGRAAFKKLFPEYYRTHPPFWHAHNMVLNKGIQMGIPGMLAFLGLWIALTAMCANGLQISSIRTWTIAVLAMIAGIFVRNMVDDFFIRDHALLFWLLCGAYLGVLRQVTQTSDRPGGSFAASAA